MNAVVLLSLCLGVPVWSFTFDPIKTTIIDLKDQLMTESETQGNMKSTLDEVVQMVEVLQNRSSLQAEAEVEKVKKDETVKGIASRLHTFQRTVGKLAEAVEGNMKSKLDEVVQMVEVLQNRSSLQAEAEVEKEKDQQTTKTALGNMLTKYNTIQTELVKKDEIVKGISSRLDTFQSTVGKLAVAVEDLKVCRSVPAVQNAEVTWEDNHVGAEATCTCKPEFRQCGTNNKITCLTTLDWEKPSASCEQFRWKNPDVTFSELLPCGKQTKLKILVKGTPMKETSMSFNIIRKEDVLFHTGFRFKWNGYRRKVAVSARINSQWKAETMPDTFPVNLHETFSLEITLENGVYKMMVNGKHLTVRPEDDVGGEPDRFEITGDLSIDKVEMMY